MNPACQVGFLVEPLAPAARGPQRGAAISALNMTWLEVPRTPCRLLAPADAPPSIQAGTAGNSGVLGECEAVEIHGRHCLAMVAQEGRPLWVNGLPAAPFAVLQPGDELDFHGRFLLHVSLRTRPYVGPPRPEDLQQECLYCRSPVGPENTAVWVCSTCGRVYHCEGEERPADVRLACARQMTTCLQCTQDVVLEERFSHVPQQ